MTDIKSQPASISPIGSEEVIEVLLTKSKTPIAYELKCNELIKECGMTQSEAETFLLQPLQLELVYSYNLGLWAIESEALESTDPFCPYTGTEIQNPDSNS
jgi:hypothetical protein